jgi:hypothetical protein
LENSIDLGSSAETSARWDALLWICARLRAGLLGGAAEPASQVPWELAIEVASFHYVTPALAACLTRADPPADVRDYFEAAASLNGVRNARMLDGLARTAGVLNAIGIEPLLLKGACLLADGTYANPAHRLLGDIDVLIPKERAAEAAAALRAAGFAEKPTDVLPPPEHHHLPMLHDPESGAGIELHTDVVSPAPDATIATAWFCEAARPAAFRDTRVLLPEPTRNAAHVIYHSQLFHHLYPVNKIQLRHLLDLALIRSRHESAIDWDALGRRFGDAYAGEALATYLGFADTLFRQPAPALRNAPRPNALTDLRETESRDSFHFQIERLKSDQVILQTELSRMIAARDLAQAEGDRLRAANATLAAERDEIAGARDHALAVHAATAAQLADAAGKLTRMEDKLAEAAGKLAERDVRLAEAMGKLADTEENLAGTAGRLAETAGELDATRRALEKVSRERTQILASRSWRWTAPLRAVMGAWRRG